MRPNFSQRSNLPELMDQLNVEAHEIYQALRELEIVNKLLGGFNVTTNALKKLDLKNIPITIADFGSGGGDVLRKIADWASKNKMNVKLVGVDFNALMTEYSLKHSKEYSNISFKTMNVFDETLLHEKIDIVTSTLFCHHFDDEDLIKLIVRMNKISRKAVIINDLHRHWFAYYSIKWITAIFSKTYLVKYDAALSVARSLTKKEWKIILFKAGIKNYTIKWMWAWRWQIIIKSDYAN